jgi:uncharacterized protein (TIGR03086 family)
MDLIDLFDRASAWTGSRVGGAVDRLDAPTPCDDWNVRRLIDHLLAGQALFASVPSEGRISPLTGPPPHLVGDDPAAQYEEARKAMLSAYSQPRALEGTIKGFGGEVPGGQVLGIAFADQLVHGWDLARATEQDATMPSDLAVAAWQMIDGRIPDDARGPGKHFKPAVAVPDTASAQERLIAYTGRMP